MFATPLMSLVALLGIAFVGTLFWVVSPEAAVALAATRGFHPAVIAVAAATGQLAAQALLYAFGHALRSRWGWFDRQCERVRLRLGATPGRGHIAVVAASAVFGVPPSSVIATLAPAFRLRASRVLPLLLAGRIARFTVVAAIAARVVHG